MSEIKPYLYDELNSEDIIFPLIKRPPQFAPSVYYTSILTDEYGNTINFNNLRGKLFQFKYNYVYEDNQESAYSEISKVPLPDGSLSISGDWVNDLTTNNAISCTIDTGSHIIKKINIAAKDTSNQNVGDFYIFMTIEKFDNNENQIINDNSAYSVMFLNNNNKRNINTPINERYFDDIPISAGEVILLDGKYLTMSQPVKNYDKVDINMELSHSFNDANFGLSPINIKTDILSSDNNNTYYKLIISNQIYTNANYWIKITFGNNEIITAKYEVFDVFPGAVVIRDSLYDSIKSDSRINSNPEFFKGTFFTDLPFESSIFYAIPKQVSDNSVKSVSATIETGSLPSIKSFKRGQYHKIGIVYNDEFGRYNVVNNSSTIFAPFPPYKAQYIQTSNISYSISSRPPIWAKTYRFVYQKNISYSYFIHLLKVEYISGGTDNIPTGYTFLKINKSLDDYRNINSKMVIPDYIWIKGDHCRIIFSDRTDVNFIPDSYEITGPFTRKYLDGTTEKTEDGFLVDGILIMPDILEIVRPNYEYLGDIFYETGDSYSIIDAGTENRRHDSNGIAQSADLSIPATGTFTFGDVYMRRRLFASTTYYVVEDSNYSDYYQSNCIDKGRPTVEILGGSKQKELYRIVRSENFIEGTEYNLLNIFLPQTEFFSVNPLYGKISGIIQSGDVLKVIQDRKETSIYVGRAMIKQADGSDVLIVSDKVFNEGNKYDSSFGTSYPHSIAANERNIYYFDDTTGDFIRSAPNGQLSLSEHYNMKSYFKRKANELRQSSNYTDIIVTIDCGYNEVLITFINGIETETIVFFEKEEQKGFTYIANIKPLSGVPDNFAWYGNKVFSFLNGILWEHNIGTENNFYGDIKPCSITFEINANSASANKYTDIEISSPDNVWDVEFNIDKGTNYMAQKSILKPAIIRKKENRLFSPILRNILSRDNIENISLLRSGNQLIGETMKVTIYNNTEGDFTLKEVEVKFLISK